jgi:hypothetical protein
MRLKRILTWSASESKVRLFRVMWRPDCGGYRSLFSVALLPKLALWERNWNGWRLVILGLSLRYATTRGAVFV